MYITAIHKHQDVEAKWPQWLQGGQSSLYLGSTLEEVPLVDSSGT